MRLSTLVFRVLSACLLTLSTFAAGAAELYQTVRFDCEGSANLSAVRSAHLGQLVDVRLERVAIVERNFVQQFMTPALELWTIHLIGTGGSRDAALVVTSDEEASGIATSVREARTVEWVGPCYVGIRLDGEDVHASQDYMINSSRWVRLAR